MNAAEALAAAKRGEATTAGMTGLVDARAANGYPGFSTIWENVFGIVGSVLTPKPNIASTVPASSQADASLLPLAVAVGGFILLTAMGGKRRRR